MTLSVLTRAVLTHHLIVCTCHLSLCSSCLPTGHFLPQLRTFSSHLTYLRLTSSHLFYIHPQPLLSEARCFQDRPRGISLVFTRPHPGLHSSGSTSINYSTVHLVVRVKRLGAIQHFSAFEVGVVPAYSLRMQNVSTISVETSTATIQNITAAHETEHPISVLFPRFAPLLILMGAVWFCYEINVEKKWHGCLSDTGAQEEPSLCFPL